MRTIAVSLGLGVVVLSAGSTASAAMLPDAISGIIGIPYHQGDSGTFNANGNIQRIFNGSGLTVGNPADATTWTHINNWQDGWQANNSTAAGTVIADLGSTTANLDKMYIWNVTESTTTVNRGTKTMDIYYATTPTVTPAAGSVYNFASGGWTLLAADVNVTIGSFSGASQYNALVDLSSVPSARYIGFDLKETHGSTTRIGLAEVQITQVPEPAGLALAGMGLLGVMAQRRRQS